VSTKKESFASIINFSGKKLPKKKERERESREEKMVKDEKAKEIVAITSVQLQVNKKLFLTLFCFFRLTTKV